VSLEAIQALIAAFSFSFASNLQSACRQGSELPALPVYRKDAFIRGHEMQPMYRGVPGRSADTRSYGVPSQDMRLRASPSQTRKMFADEYKSICQIERQSEVAEDTDTCLSRINRIKHIKMMKPKTKISVHKLS
jgi:hypothetical protein